MPIEKIDYAQLDAYLTLHLDESIHELAHLCAQPSVSVQNWGLQECAELVGQMLRQRGFAVQIHPTPGAPIVFGERRGLSNKTLLIYNHYDVQPPEPLELWETPPYEPSLRDGKLYARGVSDDKGHIVHRLFAMDAWLHALGDLPCTVKFIIEGEEECSSEHLEAFVLSHQDLLAADGCLWEFGGVDYREVPMQYLGLRGICYVELSVETARMDMHSGLGGSILPNAAWRLTWALNSLKGPDEHICIPGFYDRVRPPSERDRQLIAALPDESQQLLEEFAAFIKGLKGGPELRTVEVFEPTCTICGLTSGYQGPGSKTVQPARASAKVDFRLVPDQDPQEVLELLRRHLDAEGFPDVQIADLGSEPPARTDPDHPFVQMVVESARQPFGAPMQIVPMSGPFVHVLKLPVATQGIGSPGTRAHAPNENIRIDLYLKGAQQMARILGEFAKT